MLFSLEALRAKKGDALLVHVGPENDRKLLVIDGGPSRVYEDSLRPRLETIRQQRVGAGRLPIRLLMVSHIDDDHINGVLDLTNELRELREDQKEAIYDIENLWHNSFDDVLGNHADEIFTASRDDVGAASLASGSFENLAIAEPSAMLLASVPQGRDLRNNANLLSLEVNRPGGPLVLASAGTPVDPPFADGLETIVVGPLPERVRKLQEEWDEVLVKKGLAANVEAAAYVDRSVFNLASLVVLLRAGGREMLLTGDARGDHVLEGMEKTGLLAPGGSRHIDLLKLPHHGSNRNVETNFFRRITADHYVFSGDGSHGNPEPGTFQMLFDARQGDDRRFEIHLTYPPADYRPHRGHDYPLAELESKIDQARQDGLDFGVHQPGPQDKSVTIDLLDPYHGS